jgi:hypothetical protein
LKSYAPELTTFSLKGVWKDKALAGTPSDLQLKYPEALRRDCSFTKLDSDDKWFNNPQYRIQISEPTKVVFDLSQIDTTVVGRENSYYNIGFSVFRTSNNRSRVWDMPPPENHLCSVTNKVRKAKQTQELGGNEENSENQSNEDVEEPFPAPQGNFEGKSTMDAKQILSKERYKQSAIGSVLLEPLPNQLNTFFTILLFVNMKKSDKNQPLQIPYNLKAVSNRKIEIESLPPTIEQVIEDQWEATSSGGPYCLNPDGTGENVSWCFNPQYLLNFTAPTSLKIILQKTGKNLKKIKETRLGLSVCFLKMETENEKPERLPVVPKKRAINPRDELLQKLLEKTKEQLQVTKIIRPWRKVKIAPLEKYVESTFASTDTACVFLKVLPVEGPLLIVPCLDRPGLTGDFRMTIFSNVEVEVTALDKAMNPVVLGEWSQYNAGGSHIYNETLYSNSEKWTWVTNPMYRLAIEAKILDEVPVKVRLALFFADSNWKSKLIKKVSQGEGKKQSKKSMVSVDSMLGLYVLKAAGKVSPDGIVLQSPFNPASETVLEFEFKASDFSNMKSCLVMPATYNVL